MKYILFLFNIIFFVSTITSIVFTGTDCACFTQRATRLCWSSFQCPAPESLTAPTEAKLVSRSNSAESNLMKVRFVSRLQRFVKVFFEVDKVKNNTRFCRLAAGTFSRSETSSVCDAERLKSAQNWMKTMTQSLFCDSAEF